MTKHSTGRRDEKGQMVFSCCVDVSLAGGSRVCEGYSRGSDRVRKKYCRSPEAREMGTHVKKMEVGLQI